MFFSYGIRNGVGLIIHRAVAVSLQSSKLTALLLLLLLLLLWPCGFDLLSWCWWCAHNDASVSPDEHEEDTDSDSEEGRGIGRGGTAGKGK